MQPGLSVQKTYTNPKYDYRRSPDQEPGRLAQHRVVIVGAGPVGIAAAIDLGLRGIETVLLDDNDTVSVGSRSVCHAKRTLEILDRLGCGDSIVDRGVRWNLGKVFFGEHQVYEFNLQSEPGHRRPAFINLQQYHFEELLLRRLAELGTADLRWRNRVVDVSHSADGVLLMVETPDGPYRIGADWLIAADGAKSAVRNALGLDFRGRVFHERFLIADVVMKADFPAERWFWFDPPFHRNQSALLHRQADNVWRLDFQLGPDADPELEKQPERVLPRVKAMLGQRRGDVEFELEWVSVYTFQCRRMEHFRHGRVIFAGDAAHLVSPFGARGANSGIQDIDNLAWKLQMVLAGQAPQALLDSYDAERVVAADENILNSTRSTDFISPKNKASRIMRDAVLALAERHPFARALVNSGRLSMPTLYRDSPLNTPDSSEFGGSLRPGAPCADAPVAIDGEHAWLVDCLGAECCHGFVGLLFDEDGTVAAPAFAEDPAIGVRTLVVTMKSGIKDNFHDCDGHAFRRYDARHGTYYLIRPDQHVAARWRKFDAAAVGAALERATGKQ